jgi:hypothetical protein
MAFRGTMCDAVQEYRDALKLVNQNDEAPIGEFNRETTRALEVIRYP